MTDLLPYFLSSYRMKSLKDIESMCASTAKSF